MPGGPDFFRNLGIFVQADFPQTDECVDPCRNVSSSQEQGSIFRNDRDFLIDTNVRRVLQAKSTRAR